MTEKTWRSSITNYKGGEPLIHGYQLTELLQKVNFTQAVFLILKGEVPNEKEEAMLNAVLVASIDHGVAAPSTTIARLTISDGVPLATAVSNGVAAIGKHHGGAVEAAAKLFQEAVKNKTAAKDLVAESKEKGTRLPGFGHKIYEIDPRTQAILEVAKKVNFSGQNIDFALGVEKELNAVSGKKLPLNIDGITAAVISDLGFDWQLGNGFFIIARTVGLVAHAHEEQTREKPVAHRLKEEDIDYDGHQPRNLP